MILRYNSLIKQVLELIKGLCTFPLILFIFNWMQKGTIVEKLNEEVAKDGQHLRHLIGICEGNVEI